MNEQRGGCRCGRVRFQMRGEPMMTMACHCSGCQRMAAGAFSLSSLYASDAFEIVTGEPVPGGLRGETRHYHCPDCMSWLFTRPPGMDQFVNIRSTMLDDASGHAPFIETYTDEKLPWAVTGAAHAFATVPPEESVPGLLAEYAEWRGRVV